MSGEEGRLERQACVVRCRVVDLADAYIWAEE